MFSITRSRSRLRIKNSRSQSRPKTGRLRNPAGTGTGICLPCFVFPIKWYIFNSIWLISSLVTVACQFCMLLAPACSFGPDTCLFLWSLYLPVPLVLIPAWAVPLVLRPACSFGPDTCLFLWPLVLIPACSFGPAPDTCLLL